ncbi:MAG: deoxyribose-phosphate aldolase [Candidatus Zixiibacteriota bacterium]|nr:MAG: deoxyribose-phosphate aldolase [candidate division Zixibacteria bacterium]
MDDMLKDLNRRFDHAALQPQVTEHDIVILCREALSHDLYGVAINPVWVRRARQALTGSAVKIVSVAGFPLGAGRTDLKVAEAVKSVGDGAHEVDMVANIGWLVAEDFGKVVEEIAAVRKNLPYNVLLKVIIEAGKLTESQQIAAARAVIDGGAQFVKTSTGFFGAATTDQVTRLYKAVGGQIEVKASGGIRTVRQCREFIEAGATRLGSSASVSIMEELRSRRGDR